MFLFLLINYNFWRLLKMDRDINIEKDTEIDIRTGPETDIPPSVERVPREDREFCPLSSLQHSQRLECTCSGLNAHLCVLGAQGALPRVVFTHTEITVRPPPPHRIPSSWGQAWTSFIAVFPYLLICAWQWQTYEIYMYPGCPDKDDQMQRSWLCHSLLHVFAQMSL